MASLKDLRNRIASVKATRKITKAMQMVAAAKLRRAQEAAVAARPYSTRMSAVIGNLASAMNGQAGAPTLLTGTGFAETHLLIVAMSFAEAQTVAHKVLHMFHNGEFDVATLFFSEFKSVISQKPTALRLIPADVSGAAPADLGGAVYEAEPEEGEILADLLPRNIAVQIFRGLLENAASEQGARMSAMDNATRNAGDMINKLSIKYNRQRQAQITKELIEIISGAEAL
jgi:F0F1-type ATP synthase gamma subunit